MKLNKEQYLIVVINENDFTIILYAQNDKFLLYALFSNRNKPNPHTKVQKQ